MVQYNMKMYQIVTTRLINLQYHSLLRLNSIVATTYSLSENTHSWYIPQLIGRWRRIKLPTYAFSVPCNVFLKSWTKFPCVALFQ